MGTVKFRIYISYEYKLSEHFNKVTGQSKSFVHNFYSAKVWWTCVLDIMPGNLTLTITYTHIIFIFLNHVIVIPIHLSLRI